MKVYAYSNERGEPISFEVGNSFLGRKGFVRVIRKIPGAVIVREPERSGLQPREEEFCEFEINGQRIVAEEPFGDNSRYLVAAAPPGTACPELKIVMDRFTQQKWPFGLGGG
jgi:hypothetical protein